jgi:hypothetical protein
VHEGLASAHVLGRESPREVQGGAGDVGVDVDPAGEHDHAAGIDRATAFDLSRDTAIGDADVLDHTVDPVRRIVNLAARYPQFVLRRFRGLKRSRP